MDIQDRTSLAGEPIELVVTDLPFLVVLVIVLWTVVLFDVVVVTVLLEVRSPPPGPVTVWHK